jgi:hypothetical protein
MTERDELNTILFGMLIHIYPEKTKSIVQNLLHIKNSIKKIMKLHSLSDSDEDIMQCITNSLCFGALHSNIKDEK